MPNRDAVLALSRACLRPGPSAPRGVRAAGAVSCDCLGHRVVFADILVRGAQWLWSAVGHNLPLSVPGVL